MRIKSAIWVHALLRRAQAAGAIAMLARTGDPDAGAVYVRVNGLEGFSALLASQSHVDDSRVWYYILPDGTPDDIIEERLQREMRYDPDIWIIEIEDRQKRHFIEENIIDS